MTFDEWKKQRDSERDDEPIRLSEVWEAATKAEREAVASMFELAFQLGYNAAIENSEHEARRTALAYEKGLFDGMHEAGG